MRFAAHLLALSMLSACFERRDHESGGDPGSDADTDADSDSDTDSPPDHDTAPVVDTGDTGSQPHGGEMASFAFFLRYGVNANGRVVAVDYPGYGTLNPSLGLIEYDASNNALCTTQYRIDPTASDWAPLDYFSWEIEANGLTIDYDDCAAYTAPTVSGLSLATWVETTSMSISIAELGAATAAAYGTADTLGGQFDWNVATGSPVLITWAYEVDAGMNVLSDDGINPNPIPPADVPSGNGVVSAYYEQIQLGGFALQ